MTTLVTVIERQKKSVNHLERLMKAFNEKSSVSKTVGYVQCLLEEIESNFASYKETHEKICTITQEDSIANEDVPYIKDDIFYQGYDLFISFKSTLIDLKNEMDRPTSPVVHASTFTATNSKNDSITAGAKLPKIDLPVFSGDYLHWISYRDMFQSLVHNNTVLTDVQKYFYLKGSCTGTPLNMINEYPAADKSYELAWQALVSRYHNERKLVEQILKKLFAIPISTGTVESIKQILDTTRNSIALLKSLNIDVSSWNAILVFLTAQKLDRQSRTEWEKSLNANTKVPTMKAMLTFLETTFRTLESLDEYQPDVHIKNHTFESKSTKFDHSKKYVRQSLQANTTTSSQQTKNCPCCQKRHPLYKCFKFAALTSSQKRDLVIQYRICKNCLSDGHTHNECTLKTRCHICQELHHTILHNELNAGNTFHNNTLQRPTSNNTLTTRTNVSSNISTFRFRTSKSVLLATIQAIVKTDSCTFTLKALVDQGAQASFITEDVIQLLNLSKTRAQVSVSGIGGNSAFTARNSVSINLQSAYDTDYQLTCTALILPKLTSYEPINLSITHLPNLSNIFLADPSFLEPYKIDLILGSDIYGEILLPKMKKYEQGLLLQETHFGWMVSGPVDVKSTAITTASINICSLENQLRLFWEQEEQLDKKQESPENNACEELFASTHRRNADGRYKVHLPFKQLLSKNQLPVFHETDYNALKRLKQVEATFERRRDFAAMYKQFMNEYEILHHMENIGTYPEDLPVNCFFLPHHGVLRENSSTTKLRVVFDGGNHKPPQTSLNEQLSAGPALQNDLPTILTRWRRFKIAFRADLEKMFRQIEICEEHQNYQCILWRDYVTNSIHIYRLRTVTYGTTSAPYLAIRVLQQLATDEEATYPLASKVLITDTYVDDVISGADTLQEAIMLQQQLNGLLCSGGFNLRKWASNSTALLETIPMKNREQIDISELNYENNVKALGLTWDTVNDMFSYKVNFQYSNKLTKASLLSDACKFFDPLGWLALVTITAKIIFQKLWLAGIDWEDQLPPDIEKDWHKYRSSLKQLEHIRIPRWFGSTQLSAVELHGFCDASQLAYAAAVYIRVVTPNEETIVTLIQSKTKVAPLKTVTIPRLELCGAVLLAKLLSTIKTNIDMRIDSITFWSDSTTVLSWIKSQSSKWSVYVANRIATIQNLTNVNDWKYVSTDDNPADCASRGLMPNQLSKYTVWWQGPSWLKQPSSTWPRSIDVAHTELEIRKAQRTVNTVAIHSRELNYPHITLKFSSLSTLIRVTAYILRFYHNFKQQALEKEKGFLKSYELKRALLRLIRLTQMVCFSEEISCLQQNKHLPKSSKIIQLSPFLDDDHILRVGGRIIHSDLSYRLKHPILLSKNNPLSSLLFADAHKRTLHGGLQLMQSYVMQRYWVLSARNLAKSITRNCIVCFKYKARAYQQLMGNLPSVRLQPTRAFKHSGLDYAGPICIKKSTLRTSKTSKSYICLFICMCTKAIHLEAVTDLTTNAFIAAFQRFVARRGSCTDLYSDCGTTFVGANKELQAMYHRSKMSLPEHLVEQLSNQGTTWHFIPPASPNFGGLWEAGVKSTKYHLRRIMRDRIFTYEELSTLLAQIESCLNSRPLYPLSSDTSDFEALTPAHFLIGEPTVCTPDESLLDTTISHLSRWKAIEKVKQHFWKRWRNEYMCRLQARPKWNTINRNLQVGDLVLLLHEQGTPGNWPLARVKEVHSGSDNLVRVVTVNFKGKDLKRPISKVCLLPVNDQQHDTSLQIINCKQI